MNGPLEPAIGILVVMLLLCICMVVIAFLTGGVEKKKDR